VIVVLAITFLAQSSCCGSYDKALASFPIDRFHHLAWLLGDAHQSQPGHNLALHKSDWLEDTSSAIAAIAGHIPWSLLMAECPAPVCYVLGSRCLDSQEPSTAA
jgi:hypothetical protein